MSTVVGTTIDGRFEVVRAIGKGGYGDVFEAVQLSVERRVALKVLHPHLVERVDVSQRFRREARLTSRLDHPNAVRVIDFGVDGGLLYLVMDFVQGPTLKEHLAAHGPLCPETAVEIALGVASALHAAHSIGLVHRDLKPSNIILTPDAGGIRPVVIDFGLVKIFSEDATVEEVTASHVMVGTPAYMSPENVLGKPVDGRSDLYAVGILLFEMMSGKKPFSGGTQLEVATSRLQAPAPPLGARHPTALRELVAELLQRKPQNRVSSAEELVRRLTKRRDAGFTPTTLLEADPTVAPTRGPAASNANELAPVASAALAPSRGLSRTGAHWERTRFATSAAFFSALVVALIGIFLGTREPSELDTLEAPTFEAPHLSPSLAPPQPSPVSSGQPRPASAQIGQGDKAAEASAVALTINVLGEAKDSTGSLDLQERQHSANDEQRAEDEHHEDATRQEDVRTGVLVVNASPFGAVYVDGELAAEATPAELTLPAGEYEVSTQYSRPTMQQPSVITETVRVRGDRTVAVTHRHD